MCSMYGLYPSFWQRPDTLTCKHIMEVCFYPPKVMNVTSDPCRDLKAIKAWRYILPHPRGLLTACASELWPGRQAAGRWMLSERQQWDETSYIKTAPDGTDNGRDLFWRLIIAACVLQSPCPLTLSSVRPPHLLKAQYVVFVVQKQQKCF